MALENFTAYFPDSWQNHPKKRERPFFYAILGTVAEPYLEHLLLDVKTQRHAAAQNRVVQPRAINIAPNWLDHLLQHPHNPGMYSGMQNIKNISSCR